MVLRVITPRSDLFLGLLSAPALPATTPSRGLDCTAPYPTAARGVNGTLGRDRTVHFLPRPVADVGAAPESSPAHSWVCGFPHVPSPAWVPSDAPRRRRTQGGTHGRNEPAGRDPAPLGPIGGRPGCWAPGGRGPGRLTVGQRRVLELLEVVGLELRLVELERHEVPVGADGEARPWRDPAHRDHRSEGQGGRPGRGPRRDHHPRRDGLGRLPLRGARPQVRRVRGHGDGERVLHCDRHRGPRRAERSIGVGPPKAVGPGAPRPGPFRAPASAGGSRPGFAVSQDRSAEGRAAKLHRRVRSRNSKSHSPRSVNPSVRHMASTEVPSAPNRRSRSCPHSGASTTASQGSRAVRGPSRSPSRARALAISTRRPGSETSLRSPERLAATVRPSRSPMPSPLESANDRRYAWYRTPPRHQPAAHRSRGDDIGGTLGSPPAPAGRRCPPRVSADEPRRSSDGPSRTTRYPFGDSRRSVRYLHPSAGSCVWISKERPARVHRFAASSTSDTPSCQTRTRATASALKSARHSSPNSRFPVPSAMKSGYSGPS